MPRVRDRARHATAQPPPACRSTLVRVAAHELESESYWWTRHIHQLRVARKCNACRRELPIGESCVRFTGLYEGEFFEIFNCEEGTGCKR